MDATRKAAVLQHREEETRGAELDKEIAEESEESLLDYEDEGSSEVRIVHTHTFTKSNTHTHTHTHTTYVYIHRRMRAMKMTSYYFILFYFYFLYIGGCTRRKRQLLLDDEAMCS
jgi:hypothetical protein